MIIKFKIFLFIILSLFLFKIIINCTLNIYNKNSKIIFEIENFHEKKMEIDSHIITYYENIFINNTNNSEPKTIIFIHDISSSSFKSNLYLKYSFNYFENLGENFRIILVDLPAHGKSFKTDLFNYSYIDISSFLLKFLENTFPSNINLVCEGISSHIGLNMISLNDKFFSSLTLINPNLKYNKYLEYLKLSISSTVNKYMYFFKFLIYKNSIYKDYYISNYFSNINYNKNIIANILNNSIPVSLSNIYKNNISLYAYINTTNKYYLEKILMDLNSICNKIYIYKKQKIGYKITYFLLNN